MENNPTGIETGKLILENITQRLNKVLNIFNNVLQSENQILQYEEPIFICTEDYLFFKNNFILIAGEENFNFYEKEFLIKVIKELKFYLFNSDVNYRIVDLEDISVIEIYVYINEVEYPILRINPYFKLIESLKDEYCLSLEEKINYYQKEISALKEEEKKIELMIKKPIFGAETPLQMINYTVRKKKKIEELKIRISEISNLILDYEYKIRECQNFIEESSINLIGAESEKELIYKKLVTTFKYVSINDLVEQEKEPVEDSENEPINKKDLREINKSL